MLSDAILTLLSTIASYTPRHISQTTLPFLFTSLPDRAPQRTAESERLKYWRTLSFLKRLCLQPDLFEMLVVRILTKLDLICIPGDAVMAEEPGLSASCDEASEDMTGPIRECVDFLSGENTFQTRPQLQAKVHKGRASA